MEGFCLGDSLTSLAPQALPRTESSDFSSHLSVRSSMSVSCPACCSGALDHYRLHSWGFLTLPLLGAFSKWEFPSVGWGGKEQVREPPCCLQLGRSLTVLLGSSTRPMAHSNDASSHRLGHTVPFICLFLQDANCAACQLLLVHLPSSPLCLLNTFFRSSWNLLVPPHQDPYWYLILSKLSAPLNTCYPPTLLYFSLCHLLNFLYMYVQLIVCLSY